VTKPCLPDRLPIESLDWQKLSAHTSKAMLELARYDGTLNGIVNPEVLLSPITNREAVLSSQIEGTQATLVEVLKHEAGEIYSEAKRGEIKEIINYRTALLTGERYLEKTNISLKLIREMHAILMDGVRGADKTPGQFRDIQNWIGTKGSKIEEARFVPPAPLIMRDGLESLENFIGSDYSDPLVQLAITHAQFEILHPFNDGNGRVGRMLIPLFLYQKRVLQRPMFYLSEYLEENDQEYRDRLLSITKDGNWQGWVEFFLDAIQIQSKRNNTKAKSIHDLYERMKPRFRDVTRSQYSQAALDAFFNRPIINSGDFIKLSGITNRATANGILTHLVNAKLIFLVKAGSGKSPSVYAFTELISITEGRKFTVSRAKPKG
jgi:Fic family protein